MSTFLYKIFLKIQIFFNSLLSFIMMLNFRQGKDNFCYLFACVSVVVVVVVCVQYRVCQS